MIDIDLSYSSAHPGEVINFDYTGDTQIQEIEFAQPIDIHAEYYFSEDGVHIKGTISTLLNCNCARCLKNVEHSVDYSFKELFLELNKDNAEEGYTYEKNNLSLDKLLYDAVLLDLPQQILCSDDCKGLCSICGKDLNIESCSCDTEIMGNENNPFIKLKEFF